MFLPSHTMCVLGCSVVSDSVTPWTVAHQTSLSMGFSRQEYWSELPFPTPGDLPAPGIEPVSPGSPALASGFFTTVLPGSRHLLMLWRQHLCIHSLRGYVCTQAGEARWKHWVSRAGWTETPQDTQIHEHVATTEQPTPLQSQSHILREN